MNPIRFTATTSWYDSMKDFEPDLRLEIYDAIFQYVETREMPKLSKIAKAIFLFIKPDIDISIKRGEALAEARKRAGAKGGKKKAENLNSKQ